jgi:galactose mutarotase-like enzyme
VTVSGTDLSVVGRSHHLASGDLEAVFLPGLGMLGASLKHRGVELLRRIDDLPSSAAKGSTAGIPLLYPWANRLGGIRYRAAGREVVLDPASALLHFDDRGLPIHGVPWSRLAWNVLVASPEWLVARLAWDRTELFEVFPFRHELEMSVTLELGALTIATTLTAGKEGPVPVSFGFHPYVGLPDTPRSAWRLELPAMRRLSVDARQIPDGQESPQAALDGALGDRSFDDGFALEDEKAVYAISVGGLRIAVELLEGYRYAQVYAPEDKDFIAFEPMTSPTNALVSGRGLSVVGAGKRYRAVFRIEVRS